MQLNCIFLKSKGILDDGYIVWGEVENGMEITWLDEGYVKVLAFVLGGRLQVLITLLRIMK